MNRTVQEATIKSFHYPDFDALKAHVLAFITAYNFAKHLKALRWRTPFKTICDAWTRTPDCFKLDPYHLIPGLHTYSWEAWMPSDSAALVTPIRSAKASASSL